ncbi:MAG: hypothetical protein ACOVSW_15675 [Candidatus Kapaibacteriota bacterium]
MTGTRHPPDGEEAAGRGIPLLVKKAAGRRDTAPRQKSRRTGDTAPRQKSRRTGGYRSSSKKPPDGGDTAPRQKSRRTGNTRRGIPLLVKKAAQRGENRAIRRLLRRRVACFSARWLLSAGSRF